MTRQAASSAFPRLGDCRSWILHYDIGYDYVTQSPSSSGDIYLGGGLWKALIAGQVSVEEADIGNVRDDLQNQVALDIIEASVEERLQHGNGTQTLDKWTGVMGFTMDNCPIVGKVPYHISERPLASNQQGREWIAAGFSGNGMVNCWLTGKAIADMLLKGEESVKDWFPLEQYACSQERLQRTTLLDRFLEILQEAGV